MERHVGYILFGNVIRLTANIWEIALETNRSCCKTLIPSYQIFEFIFQFQQTIKLAYGQFFLSANECFHASGNIKINSFLKVTSSVLHFIKSFPCLWSMP